VLEYLKFNNANYPKCQSEGEGGTKQKKIVPMCYLLVLCHVICFKKGSKDLHESCSIGNQTKAGKFGHLVMSTATRSKLK